jgi:hypothetical protein
LGRGMLLSSLISKKTQQPAPAKIPTIETGTATALEMASTSFQRGSPLHEAARTSSSSSGRTSPASRISPSEHLSPITEHKPRTPLQQMQQIRKSAQSEAGDRSQFMSSTEDVFTRAGTGAVAPSASSGSSALRSLSRGRGIALTSRLKSTTSKPSVEEADLSKLSISSRSPPRLSPIELSTSQGSPALPKPIAQLPQIEKSQDSSESTLIG